MDNGLIPRRYAKALYEVGLERHDSDNLYKLMLALGDAFVHTDGLAHTVANPFVSNDDKTALLTSAVYGSDKSNVDPTYVDFLKLLATNGRISYMRAIAQAYVDIYRKANDIYRVDICSAAPLAEAGRSRLEKLVKEHIGKGTVEFDYKVDPALTGGFIVTVNSERLDASVQSRLKQLRLKLIQ